MHQFKDAQGRAWEIPVIDMPAVRDVRQAAGVNLTRNDDLGRVVNDGLLAADVLAVLCRKQIESRKMQPEDFDRLFNDGDVRQAAQAQLVKAVLDFFPTNQRRAFAKLLEVSEKMQGAVLEELQAADPEAAGLGRLTSTLRGLAGSSPGDSGSAPPASPSANSA